MRLKKSSRAQRDKPSFMACQGSRAASATRGCALRGVAATDSALGAGGDSVGAPFAASSLPAALRPPALGAVFISATRGSVLASGDSTPAPVAPGRFCAASRGNAMAGAASRAGTGTELFGVREYRPGDPLRRIHWRSSARHGELIVREYEPPGIQSLGIFCDPAPPTREAADQIARLAASEAWDCLRSGGRAVLWSPGAEPSTYDESRSIWALLEWLARYPAPVEGLDLPPPRVSDAVAVVARYNAPVIDALEGVKQRGGDIRAWVVGEAVFDVDAPVQNVGLGWPL